MILSITRYEVMCIYSGLITIVCVQPWLLFCGMHLRSSHTLTGCGAKPSVLSEWVGWPIYTLVGGWE